jgi:hypothetical protein
MTPVSSHAATELARASLGLAAALPAAADRVLRLDRAASYYLIRFGAPNACVAVAAVDTETGSVLSSARLEGRAGHLPVDAALARRLAGAPADVPARLVWSPAAPSRSPLYPFWHIETADGARYVDQERRVWRDLTSTVRGG